jgi:uncharacterized delta-60 repeat protein/uncharacterized repeat protein (TIGR01451 family)
MNNQILSCLKKVSILLLLLIFCQSYLQAQPGAIDPAFNVGTGANANIQTTAIQNDGKIIIVGEFTTYNGIARNYIARLNADGSLDNSFNIGAGANSYVNTIVIQSDGKIIIGGQFTTYNGTTRNSIARLNTDGSLDASFNAGTVTGAAGDIFTAAIQSDGKIIIGGGFETYPGGAATNRIARLNPDGSLDASFNVGNGADNHVFTIAIQSDGKIIIGGYFNFYNGTLRGRIARLNTNGSLDASFNVGSAANNRVETIAIQSDGKIIIGGDFTTFNGYTKNCIARLNRDGSLDTGFNTGIGANNIVYAISIQNDGKVIIGGGFTFYNGTAINRIARLNTDGSLDTGFNPGTGPNNSVNVIAIQNDGHILVVGNFTTYNTIVYNYIVRLQGDPIYYNTIEGNIFIDNNNDCVLQTSEKQISSVIVKALPGPYYKGSDAYGHYKLGVDSGSAVYTLKQENNSINSKLLLNQCASSQTVSLTGASKDTCCFNFADSVRQCALLNITVQHLGMRPCFSHPTYVNYANYGSSSAVGVQIKVEYSSNSFPIYSYPIWSSKQGSTLIYNVGTLPAGVFGLIVISDSVACNIALTGLTECIKASISPSSNCIPINPAWDKSSMKVTGSCSSGNAHFIISNDGTGDMASSLQYRVYENDSLIFTGTYQLKSGENLTVDYPAQGQTIRLEADQNSFHPGNSHPRATIENCGLASPAVRNLITTAPQDDLDEEVAITCGIIQNSHDPNEKQAFPSGIGSAHNIAPGEEIEYVIHFQNTGTATAYTVTVVDTLDAGLDVASFTQGASSNPYTLSISGKGQAVLTFRFDQINLPDSTTNNLASSGLVSYRMTVPDTASIGTVIKNKAYIYFDYNAPVITNETMHTVDTITHKDLSKGSAVHVGAITTGLTARKFIQIAKIYPNPTTGLITVEMPETGNNSELRIISLVGSLQKSVPLSSAIQQVSLESLSQGMYLYEIWQNGERKAGGKLQIW